MKRFLKEFWRELLAYRLSWREVAEILLVAGIGSVIGHILQNYVL